MRRKREARCARGGGREKENSSHDAHTRTHMHTHTHARSGEAAVSLSGEFLSPIFFHTRQPAARRSEIAYLSSANRYQLLLIERCYLMHVGAGRRYRSFAISISNVRARAEKKGAWTASRWSPARGERRRSVLSGRENFNTAPYRGVIQFNGGILLHGILLYESLPRLIPPQNLIPGTPRGSSRREESPRSYYDPDVPPRPSEITSAVSEPRLEWPRISAPSEWLL